MAVGSSVELPSVWSRRGIFKVGAGRVKTRVHEPTPEERLDRHLKNRPCVDGSNRPTGSRRRDGCELSRGGLPGQAAWRGREADAEKPAWFGP